MTLADLVRVYEGSDGDATKALYGSLERFGAVGIVAVNLFRAQKNSERAKVYRGGMRGGKGSYRQLAYDRKQWAMGNLCNVLGEHAATLGLVWGWQADSDTLGFPWVLYIDLPTGQVSFHTGTRGEGPDFPGTWDRVRGASPDRLLRWIARLYQGVPV